jgi:hypothetical protein
MPTRIRKVMGLSMINDVGINLDHALIISNIELGLEKFEICRDREEKIDFRKVMNIPMQKRAIYIPPWIQM